MQESEYWDELRTLINNYGENTIGWCDWFEPKKYCLGVDSYIEGNVGFVDGRSADQWKFVLFLNSDVEETNEINWNELLPSADQKEWIRLNHDTKSLELNLKSQ